MQFVQDEFVRYNNCNLYNSWTFKQIEWPWPCNTDPDQIKLRSGYRLRTRFYSCNRYQGQNCEQPARSVSLYFVTSSDVVEPGQTHVLERFTQARVNKVSHCSLCPSLVIRARLGQAHVSATCYQARLYRSRPSPCYCYIYQMRLLIAKPLQVLVLWLWT